MGEPSDDPLPGLGLAFESSLWASSASLGGIVVETDSFGFRGLKSDVVYAPPGMNLANLGSTFGLPVRYSKLVVSSRCLMNALAPGYASITSRDKGPPTLPYRLTYRTRSASFSCSFL